MKYLYGSLVLCCLVLWSSCRNDFESAPSTGTLEFSRDTVYLDTVFTNIGSSTYNLKVYNRSNQDITVPSIRLAQGDGSDYRLNVDGLPGKNFNDIQILAKDSIFIFIETTFDINTTNQNQFLYTDQILFDTGANEQKVELVTLVKDAVFLFPERFADGTTETLNLGVDQDGNDILVKGFFLEDDELTFTNEKPYVIYGYAAVPPNKTLNIQPGARVHFHNDGGIIVANTGSIKSIGVQSFTDDLENEIIFEGDRLEPDYSDVPGQWLTILLTQGSIDNRFEFTTIKNSTVGILMDDVDSNGTLSLKNVQIYNNANVGLLARNATVYGENVVINNSGQVSLACSLGGSYEFNHCTFANYWTQGFRSLPSVLIDNVVETETETIVSDLLQANFTNCIIYGNERRELGLVKNDLGAFNFKFRNCLIRFEDPQGEFAGDPLYDFSNPLLYENSIFSADPAFQNTENNNFNIETGVSGADGIGVFLPSVDKDLNGVTRISPVDAGAYESVDFPEE